METLRDLVQLHVFPDALYDQNCYFLRRRDTQQALLIDPGLQTPDVLRVLEREGLNCDQILLTHGHPDHINGVPFVKENFNCPAAIHGDDRWLLESFRPIPGIPEDLPPIECEQDLHDNQIIEWQGLNIQVLHTPGHTPGSVCFLLTPDLISGDTLFRRGIGRTDFPRGSYQSIVFSIENRIYTLPPETVVHPGHGPETTVDEEMKGNPFVPHPKYR